MRKVRFHPELSFAVVEGGAMVLLAPHGNTMFHLNRSGGALCSALRRHDGLVEFAVSAVAKEYELELECVREHFELLLRQLGRYNLLEVVE